MFFLPEKFDAEDHLQLVTEAQIEEVASSTNIISNPKSDNIYQEYYEYVIKQEDLEEAQNWQQSLSSPESSLNVLIPNATS